jgi:hypothetical protein
MRPRSPRSVVASSVTGSRWSNRVIRKLFLTISWLCSAQVCSHSHGNSESGSIITLRLPFSSSSAWQKEFLFHRSSAQVSWLTTVGPIWSRAFGHMLNPEQIIMARKVECEGWSVSPGSCTHLNHLNHRDYENGQDGPPLGCWGVSR